MDLSRRNMVFRIIYILLGSFIYAISINALYIPHKLLSGGLTGVSMMLEYLFGIPTGLSVVVLNIPLFFGSYRFIGKRFTYLSIIGITASSVFLLLTKNWIIPVSDSMVAAIFGGLISGIGMGIVIKSRGSLGGTDIISVIINKYFSFSIGGIAIAINAVILGISAFLFNVEMAMLTIVAIYVANHAVDAIQEGFNHRKTIIIVTDHYQEIADELLKKVKRGITFINGEGAYTGKEKKLIYMVVRVMELARTKDIVHRIDPGAFLSIIDTREVEGKGFNINDYFREE
ncbi:MAG TPA: YitT family protein [Clostridiales bacterium]|nr:YitT family protein [Clostridiales bacterium]